MKLFIVGLLVVMSHSSFATSKNYELKMEMSLNSKVISSPKIIVSDNAPGMISHKTESEENFIEVTATEGKIGKTKGIMMSFVIGSIEKNGQRTILSQPKILAKENELAKISIDDGHAGDELVFSVVAKRVTKGVKSSLQ